MCSAFKQNVKKFNAIAHKKFCTYVTARKAFTDTNLLVAVIGEPKSFTDAVCQNLTYLKFSLRFLRENLSITCSRLMIRSP